MPGEVSLIANRYFASFLGAFPWMHQQCRGEGLIGEGFSEPPEPIQPGCARASVHGVRLAGEP